VKLALVAAPTPAGRDAEDALRGRYDFVPMTEADVVVVLGGDGQMLQHLHGQLDERGPRPVFGMNRGTVGFLLNGYDEAGLLDRIARARAFTCRRSTRCRCSAKRARPRRSRSRWTGGW
jgi:NAD+ kinase